MSEFWNKRYSETEYVYGKSPNEFLKGELNEILPGKILFLGEGEGRNSVYAATLGWEVDAVDASYEGKKKADKLAEEKHVKINYTVNDLASYSCRQNYYDAVALIFLHLEEPLRNKVYHMAVGALKNGGRIILESFDKDQLNYNSGGPKEEELLYSLEDIVNDFIELDFAKLSKEIVELNEGKFHEGKGSVVRFVGIKP
ncbi:MAG: class I SAM-dependent methyltransferase [Bacteroidetes bacterium]|nr:class I SAM-dependent methyltransferase [Bacteroidota bacterium]